MGRFVVLSPLQLWILPQRWYTWCWVRWIGTTWADNVPAKSTDLCTRGQTCACTSKHILSNICIQFIICGSPRNIPDPFIDPYPNIYYIYIYIIYMLWFWYLYDPVCKFLCSSWADAFLTLAGLRHCRRHWWRLQKWQTSGTHTYTHRYIYIYIFLESGRERERERDMPFFIMSSLSFGRIVQRRK